MKNTLIKSMTVAAAALLALSGAAFADGDMSNTYGHIVRVTGPDSSFDATFVEGGAYSDTRGITGSWSVGEQLCITVQAETGPQENCGPWNSALQPGESWSTTGWTDDGTAITVEIIAAQ
ncbi:hypothetical protein [uncultured Maricaulis sp.]|uniref:hypothetical protein n=1 Tax=uncultured Maricaulis sp. TaxID=174710 RepID=UPI0030D9C440